MWDRILAVLPEATLDIFCDVEHKWVKENCKEEYERVKAQMDRWKGHPSIHHHGWTSKKVLYQHWQMAQFWLYPCLFRETFCMTALEAAASKTLAITNNLGSLEDTVGDRGIKVLGDPLSEEWQATAVDAIMYAIKNPENVNTLVEKNYQWALEHTWQNQANQLLKEVEKYPLRYVGMYNWAHDLPPGTLEPMKSILSNTFNSTGKHTRILEVGTWSGTALIEFMNIIPNSTAVAIDLWQSYIEDFKSNGGSISTNIDVYRVEDAFYENLRTAGVQDRVEVMKMDKNQALIQLVQQQQVFDFIYLDVSKECMNVFFDLVMSLKLLRQHGLIIVDDYLYEYNTFDMCPKVGVEKFIEQYSDQVEVVRKDYRCFLRKL